MKHACSLVSIVHLLGPYKRTDGKAVRRDSGERETGPMVASKAASRAVERELRRPRERLVHTAWRWERRLTRRILGKAVGSWELGERASERKDVWLTTPDKTLARNSCARKEASQRENTEVAVNVIPRHEDEVGLEVVGLVMVADAVIYVEIAVAQTSIFVTYHHEPQLGEARGTGRAS
jgi:hypothetical protein